MHLFLQLYIHKYFTIVYNDYFTVFTFPTKFFDKLVFIFQEGHWIDSLRRFFPHKFLTSFKLSLGPCELPHKCWAWLVQLFGRLLDTNGQTNRQVKYINRVRTRKL